MQGILNIKKYLQDHNMKSFKAGISEQLSATKTKHAVNLNPCYKKVKDCTIDSGIDLESLSFCGTNNGIMNVTETVGFDINRLKYRTDLHNQSFGGKGSNLVFVSICACN